MTREERWNRLHRRDQKKLQAGKGPLWNSEPNRYGLLSSCNSDQPGICRCLACDGHFSSWGEGRAHECPQEAEFREAVPARNQPLASSVCGDEVQDDIKNLKVRYKELIKSFLNLARRVDKVEGHGKGLLSWLTGRR